MNDYLFLVGGDLALSVDQNHRNLGEEKKSKIEMEMDIVSMNIGLGEVWPCQ